MQLAEFDGTISAKDVEIEQLKSRLHSVSDESSLPRGSPLRTPLEGETEDILPAHQRGRAPPVEMFSGEDGENTLDDWLPLWCEQSGTDGPNLNYSASSTPERTCRLETEKSEYEKGV